ncbi:DMT family transporter [Salinisphaera sp. LB1]|uniref:DMT family transporter n=1 Tax=Salinisphaera sp. LB1 TaxID=2183911 RepID=UPI001C9E5264|nr:DMT family transporter [Salinisphaera sp. LB1]
MSMAWWLAGPPLIIAAAAFWGLSGGLSGLLIEHGWAPLLVAFCRGLIGGALILGWWLLAPGRYRRPDWRMLAASAIAGVGVAGNLGFYCISIAHTSVAVAATLLYTAPLYVYLAALVMRTERLRWPRLLALALIILGVVLLTRVFQVDPAKLSWLGILAGLGGGLSYAVFIFGFGQATRYGRPPSVLAIAFAVFVVVLLPLIDIGRAGAALGSADVGLFVALGLAGGGLSFPLYVAGLRDTSPVLASVVAMMEPVTAALFGVGVLGNTLAPLQLVGMALIIGIVTLLSVQRARSQQA